jgi:hypothetical protein
MFALTDDATLKSKRVKNWNYVVRKHFTYLELADYCSIRVINWNPTHVTHDGCVVSISANTKNKATSPQLNSINI